MYDRQSDWSVQLDLSLFNATHKKIADPAKVVCMPQMYRVLRLLVEALLVQYYVLTLYNIPFFCIIILQEERDHYMVRYA